MSSWKWSAIDAGHHAQRWIRARPLLIDLGVAALGAILCITDLYTTDSAPARDPDALALVLILSGSTALIVRRRAPFFVLALVLCVMVVIYGREYDAFLSGIGLPAFYTVVAIGEPRRRAWAAVVVGTFGLFAIACFTILRTADGFDFASATGMVAFLLTTILAGVFVRNRHEIFLSTKARADEAEADRFATAERAVARERLRIAREMHDVVAHGMSVISVQAAAAQATFETRPDRTLDLLQSIEATSRESLTEMRRMLAVLRNGDFGHASSDLDLAPQPSLRDLDRLIIGCTEAGTPTTMEIAGLPRPLAPGVELAIYRIAQEALTNVRKHGGRTASVRVEILYAPEEICLTITDTGRGIVAARPSNGSGNGLVGMRERVDAYGGHLSTGPRLGGGYEVIACLPVLMSERAVTS